MRHRDARNLRQALTEQNRNVFNTALAQFPVDQADVNAGIVLTLRVGCVHAREGVLNFWELAHNGLHLLGLQCGAFKRGTYGGLKIQSGF